LALDKVLPNRDFLQILRVSKSDPERGRVLQPSKTSSSSGGGDDGGYQLEHDLQWLAILSKTHSLLNDTKTVVTMPQVFPNITQEDQADVMARVQAFTGRESLHIAAFPPQPVQPSQPDRGNAQTDSFLAMLGLPHCWTVPSVSTVVRAVATVDPNELSIDDDDENEGEGNTNQRNNTNDRDDNEICISDDESDCHDDSVEVDIALEDECIVFKPSGLSVTSSSVGGGVSTASVGTRNPVDVIDLDSYDDSSPPSFMPFPKK